MTATRWTAMIVSVLTLSVGACARNGAPRGEDVSLASRSVSVLVTNNNYWDMKVYALIGSSVSIRLGTVTGVSSARFTAQPSMFPTGTLHLVASQLGGRDMADSGPLPVFGGESVTFTIQPNTGTSFAFVR
jgi:hypothetical protein